MRGQPQVTHLLLDFFGTLVSYSPSRTEQGYPQSHALLRAMGARIGYAEFLAAWTAESARFDARSAADDSEFSMAEVAGTFLQAILGRTPSPAEITNMVDTYLREWNTTVVYPPGMAELVATLGRRFRLAVVTNTHQAGLVPSHLGAMGIAGLFEAVITSVEVGWRKPHPTIYAAALERLGIDAAAAIFAGDTYLADYAGPRAAGLSAFLIDPSGRYELPPGHRLSSLNDLPGRLGIG